jgi:hypothetical protein
MSMPRRGVWAAAAAVTATLTAFFAPALFGPGQFVYRDTGIMHTPMKRWIADEFAAGRFPQWNPWSGLGTPIVANAIDAIHHPFNLLLLALPPDAAIKAWILLSFALAAAGAFAWARTLGSSPAACAVAAIGFALSGPVVSASDNTTYLTAYATLPWVFAAAAVFLSRGGPLPLAGVAAASALCASAGDPQAWAIAVGLVPIYAVATAPSGKRRPALARGLAAAAAAAAAAAPFILPTALWYPLTSRAGGGGGADMWNLHPARLLELVVPDLFRGDPGDPTPAVFGVYAGNAVTPLPWFLSVYLGATALALALLGAARDRSARLFVIGGAVFCWAALGPHAGFSAIAVHLPVLGSFRYWEKLAVWVALFVALAAARGVDAALPTNGSSRMVRTAAIAAALLLVTAAVGLGEPGWVAGVAGGGHEAAATLAQNLASGAGRAGLLLALLALLLTARARERLGRFGPAALATLLAVDLLGGNAGAYLLGPFAPTDRPPIAAGLEAGARIFGPFEEREDRWPEMGRVVGKAEWSRRTLGPAWNVPLRIGSYQDYVGLRDARWTRVRSAIGNGNRLVGYGLFGFSYLVVPGNPSLSSRAGVAPPLRIATSDPVLPAWLIEIPHRPRAYVATKVSTATEEEALSFASGGGADGRTLIEGPIPKGAVASRGDARIICDDPGDTRVEARSEGPGLLVLNDGFAPGWSASVDGSPVPIVRANGLVRGVWLESGTHLVRFRYRTPGLAAGWAIALAGTVMLGLWGLIRRRSWLGTTLAERTGSP